MYIKVVKNLIIRIMLRKSPSYNEKINAICVYFNISKDTARYIYHRRRRGFPCKRIDDPKFLRWSIPIQNAFVKSDVLNTIYWNDVSFDNDLKILNDAGIVVDETNTDVYINEINYKQIEVENKDDGWTIVTSKKTHSGQKQLLQTMGFLPNFKSSKKLVSRKD
jgi:hypothetical protein